MQKREGRGKVRDQRLTAKSVCHLVKSYAGRLGLNVADFGAHSLRAGFLTSAARRAPQFSRLRDVSRHKSITCCKRICATRICPTITPGRGCCKQGLAAEPRTGV